MVTRWAVETQFRQRASTLGGKCRRPSPCTLPTAPSAVADVPAVPASQGTGEDLLPAVGVRCCCSAAWPQALVRGDALGAARTVC